MEKINLLEEQEFARKLLTLINFIKFWVFCGTLKSESQISAKCEFLKVLSYVYDLSGIVSPTIITLKMLFQKICMMRINWDDVLPEVIIAEWQNILENVNVTNSFKLERHYLKMFDLKDVEIIEYMAFQMLI